MPNPSPALPWHSKGVAFLEMRDHLQEAEAAFRAGLQADPDHPGCTLQMGITMRGMGRMKTATKWLNRAAGLAPEDPQVHVQLGLTLRQQKKLGEALNAYDVALGLDSALVEARAHRATLLLEMNREAESMAVYDELIAELPAPVSAARGFADRRAEVAGRLARRAQCDPGASLAHQALAIALYRRANQLIIQGDVDEAVLHYQDAALLAPNYADPEFPIGETAAVQLSRRPYVEYLGCPWIEGGLNFHVDKLRFCCTWHSGYKGWTEIGTYHGGPVPIDFVLARRAQLNRENQVGTPNECHSCSELKHRVWAPEASAFDTLIVNSFSICNMKCTYCSLATARFEMPAYYYMAEPAIDSLIAGGFLNPGTCVVWGGGDPCVSEEFPRIAEKLLRHGCNLNVNTNATRLLPVLLEALQQGHAEVAISVDSGTPETFYRIKFNCGHPVMIQGRPAFEVVWENIRAYVQASGGHVLIKYIFTAENIGEPDLTGFIGLCQAVGVTRISLTLELSDVSGNCVPAAVAEAIDRARAMGEASGLVVYFNPIQDQVEIMAENASPCPGSANLQK